MQRFFLGMMFVCAIAALVAVPGCQGDQHGDDGCGCASACGCGCGAANAGGGCGDGCGCAACGCGGGCDGGCGGCGCGCGAGEAVSGGDAARAMAHFKAYRKWHKANDKAFLSKPHGRHMIHDYVNSVARGTFASGKGNYRPGAVVVKEGWKKGKRSMVWIMEKRRSGYDRENGDWWYAQMNVAGKVSKAGKVQACIDCHDDDDANDYVYGVK